MFRAISIDIAAYDLPSGIDPSGTSGERVKTWRINRNIAASIEQKTVGTVETVEPHDL